MQLVHAEEVVDAVESTQAAFCSVSLFRQRSSGRGQGFQLDQEVGAAVEALAMNAATEFYSKDWPVDDVHAKESYDLIRRRSDEVKHVEADT